MSNAFFIWPLLFISFTQLALAGPHSMVSLSPSVASVVPRCAQQCLKSFIADDFPKKICRNQQRRTCLCSRKSVSGLTLGEGALRCVASACSNSVLQASLDVYDLCEDIRSAEPMTHGTLTATRASPTTVPPTPLTRTMATPDSTWLSSCIPSSIAAPDPSISANPLTTSLVFASSWTSSPSPSLPASTVPSSSTLTTSSSSTTFAASPASSAAPPPKAALTNPQIAGVTVAGVASAALAFGILFCIFWLRRKKSQKRMSGSSFGGDNVIETRPGSPSLPSAAARYSTDGRQASGLLNIEDPQSNGLRSEDDRSRWSFSKRNTRIEDIGVAVAHGTHLDPLHSDAPGSATGHRTTSRLLPDKPVYSLYPPRLRVVNAGTSPVSPQSPDISNAVSSLSADACQRSKPAYRGRNTMDTSQRSLQEENRVVRPSVSDPFLDLHRDAEGLIYAGENGSPGASAWTRSLETVRKPVPAHQNQPITMRSHPDLQMRDPCVYVGRPTFGMSPEHIKPAEQAIRSKPKRKSSVHRPSTVFSTTSETSFEDDEMPTRRSALSSTARSPKLRMPPGTIRYPMVPGSAAPFDLSRRPSPESPTPRPPPKNPLRAIVTQHGNLSNNYPRPQVAELAGRPVTSPVSPLAKRSDNPQGQDSPRSAKWKILVAPGLEGIENFGAQSPGVTEPARSR